VTREEIMEMVEEAGPLVSTPFDVWCKRFAALVAAAEREECAKVCTEEAPSLEGQLCADAIRARGDA